MFGYTHYSSYAGLCVTCILTASSICVPALGLHILHQEIVFWSTTFYTKKMYYMISWEWAIVWVIFCYDKS